MVSNFRMPNIDRLIIPEDKDQTMRKRHYQQSATSSVTDAFNSIQLHDDSKMLAEQSSQDPRIKIKTKRATGGEFLAPVEKKRE